LYAETPSNPLLTVLDLEEFGQLGRADDAGDHDGHHEILTVVDATFASPQLVKPIKYGVDIVIHSAYVYDTLHRHYLWTSGVIGTKCEHCLFVCFYIVGLLEDMDH